MTVRTIGKEFSLAFVNEKEETKLQYDRYYFSRNELLKYIAISEFIIITIAYLFYRSILAVIIMNPFIILYLRNKQNELLKLKVNKLNIQFKDAILSISGSLNAGYSIENACKKALSDLIILYGEDEIIVKEFKYIVRQLDLNYTVESLFYELADRSGIEDIKSFAEVFGAAKRNGGDVISIINSTAASISEKIDIKQEIYTVMSAKRLEQKIMNVVPFIIILYVNISSPGFLHIMYHNMAGVLIISIGLLIYFAEYYMAEKIVSIEI